MAIKKNNNSHNRYIVARRSVGPAYVDDNKTQ